MPWLKRLPTEAAFALTSAQRAVPLPPAFIRVPLLLQLAETCILPVVTSVLVVGLRIALVAAASKARDLGAKAQPTKEDFELNARCCYLDATLNPRHAAGFLVDRVDCTRRVSQSPTYSIQHCRARSWRSPWALACTRGTIRGTTHNGSRPRRIRVDGRGCGVQHHHIDVLHPCHIDIQ